MPSGADLGWCAQDVMLHWASGDGRRLLNGSMVFDWCVLLCLLPVDRRRSTGATMVACISCYLVLGATRVETHVHTLLSVP